MKRRGLFFLGLFSATLLGIQVTMAGSVEVKIPSTKRVSERFTHQRGDDQAVIKVTPATVNPKVSKFEYALHQARLAGLAEATQGLQSQLDTITGNTVRWLPVDGKKSVVTTLDNPPAMPKWAGDIPVSGTGYIKPSMAENADGDLFIAAEDTTTRWIRLYRSTDGGLNWSMIIGFGNGTDNHNPSVTCAGDYVYTAFEAVTEGFHSVMIFRYKPSDGSFNFITVENNIYMADASDHIYPEICTDTLTYGNGFYVYITYALYAIDYYPVYFSKSTDKGVTWTTPTNITGGAENSQWSTRPDIAYGNDLFVVFEKLGWNGSSLVEQTWVTKSTNWGATWDTPAQLTSSTYGAYHPRVSAATDSDSVIVAYTHEYSSDTDVKGYATTDSGATWSFFSLPWTLDDEESVELSVSRSGELFHAVFWNEYDILYTCADTISPTTWEAGEVVNDTNQASLSYARPAVAVYPLVPESQEASVAWTDFRSGYKVYFDKVGEDSKANKSSVD
ncbi:MAG: exo-alpha-sialidase [Desulfobacteraceae bacterium]|nr:exo-alpha-sialidase [Desulfobacteraceae bacterium]